MRQGINGGQLQLLSEEKVEQIHDGALRILEETGLKVESEEALDLLDEGGATIDREKELVKFPRSLVNECIEETPSDIHLSARESDNDLLMEPERSFVSSSQGPSFVYDYEQGQGRAPQRKDMRNGVKLQNELSNIDMSWGMFTLRDEPMLGFIGLYELFANNTKHNCILSHYGGNLTKKLVDMVEIVVDNEDVTNKNLVTMYNQPVSPLSLRRETTESLLEWTKAGFPLISCPAPQMGATSPMTLAGTAAQSFAEALGGVVIGQLNNPGTPMLVGAGVGPMDMRIGSHQYFHAENILWDSFTAQWARKYEIPVFGFGGVSDSYGADYQLGAETAISLYGAILSGQNHIHDLGVIGSGFRNSLEVLTVLDEMVGMIKRVTQGMIVNEETMAIDVIDEVGHGSSYLSEAHTRKFGKTEIFMPDMMKKREVEDWSMNIALDDAHNKVKNLLADADPKPLPSDVDAQLQQIMGEAENLAEDLEEL